MYQKQERRYKMNNKINIEEDKERLENEEVYWKRIYTKTK